MERSRSVGPLRSSLRSRDSSSTRSSDPREKVKDCCRKLVAFMCTQVGVGGLVVGYTIVGAFGFMSIETQEEYKDLLIVEQQRAACAEELWKVTAEHNMFNRTIWKENVDKKLQGFQENFAGLVKKGYNGRSVNELWTFPAALMFSLSIITMIGYGNMVPRTEWGKGATVIYAVFGIPLYVLYFMNMGKVLAQTFRWLYTWLYRCTSEPQEESDIEDGDLPACPKRVIVPSTACLWVISGYVLTGAIMFANWEDWDYLDSTYFCVTSLCKIGLGDLVPGANIRESKGGNQTKLVINFVYMLLGMGLVAMCYNLMREEVRVKVREVKEDLGQCLEDVRVRLMNCCGRKKRRRRSVV